MKGLNEFDTIYNDLYNKNINELKKLKGNLKSAKVGITISIIVLILDFLSMMAFFNYYLLATFIVFLIVLGLCIVMYNKDKKKRDTGLDYSSYYKINIIKPMFDKVFGEVNYDLNSKISSKEYEICEWGTYDYYDSKDLIQAKIGKHDMRLSTVYTSRQENVNYETSHIEFSGLFGIINLNKKVDKEIKVVKVKTKSKDNNFESYFLANSELNDKIKEVLLNAYLESKDEIDLFIKEDKVYFRIHWFEPFEVSIFGNPLDKKKIKELYKLINLIKDITEIIINTLEA